MKPKHKGFTLLELMVVLIIMGILAAFAAPSYRRMIAAGKVRDFSERWQTAFYYAQKEALQRNDRVQLCATSDGINCATGPDAGNFAKGWMVVAPNDSGGVEVLQDTAINVPDLTATFNNPIRGCNSALCFLHNGRLPSNFLGATLTISLPIGDSGKSVTKALVLNTAGRIRVEDRSN